MAEWYPEPPSEVAQGHYPSAQMISNLDYVLTEECLSRVAIVLLTRVEDDEPYTTRRNEGRNYDDDLSNFAESEYDWGRRYPVRERRSLIDTTGEEEISEEPASDSDKDNESDVLQFGPESDDDDVEDYKPPEGGRRRRERKSRGLGPKHKKLEAQKGKKGSRPWRYQPSRSELACLDCKEVFKSLKKLGVHAETHGTEKPFICRLCKEPFADEQAFVSHKTNDGDLCERNAPKVTKAVRPKRRSHYQPSKAERTCSDCSEVFKSLKLLGVHAETHGTEKPFICALCKMAFPDIPEFISHKTTDHDKKTNVTKQIRLQRRSTQISWTPADYICHYCGKKFDSPIELRGHKKVHRKGSNHTCELCNFPCKSKETLRHHFQLIHLGFKHTGSAKKMQRKLQESNEVPEEIQRAPNYVTCDQCGKVYWWQYRLDEHKNRVHGIKTGQSGKPHACYECGLFFRSKNCLVQHFNSKKHSKDKALICETCGKTFRKSEGLRKHIGREHPEVPLPRRYEYGPSAYDEPYEVNNHSIFDDLMFDETPFLEELTQLSTAEGQAQGESPSVQPQTHDTIAVSTATVPVPESHIPPGPVGQLAIGQLPIGPQPLPDPITAAMAEIHSVQSFFEEDPAHFVQVNQYEQIDVKPNLPHMEQEPEPFGAGADDDHDTIPSPASGNRSDDDSDFEIHLDKERLKRLRRACKRRSLRSTEHRYHDVPVDVKIEEQDDDSQVDDDNEDARVKRTPKSRKIPRKRKPESGMKCRLAGCSFRALDRTDLAQHRLDSHGRSSAIRSYDFKCDKCTFKGTSPQSLDVHKLTHGNVSAQDSHSSTGTTPRSRSLSRNIQRKRLSGSKLPPSSTRAPGKKKRKPEVGIKCRLGGCRFRAIDRPQLAAHRLEIHGRGEVRSYEFKCTEPFCTFRARYAESYESHMLTHKPGYAASVNAPAPADTTPGIPTTKLGSKAKPKLNHPYPCTHPGCTKGFSHRIRLIAHIQNFHQKASQAESKEVPTPSSEFVIVSDIYKNPRICRVQGCKVVALKRSELEAHRLSCHGRAWARTVRKPRARSKVAVKWLYCGIDSCSFRALLPESISNHKRIVHDQLPPAPSYPCPQCEKTFSTNAYRQTHINLKHTGGTAPRVPCLHCSRDFSCRIALFGHLQRAHPDEATYPCVICTKIFYYEDERTLHEERHRKLGASTATQFKCAVQNCIEVCVNQESLIDHVKTMHDIPIDAKTICPICGKECLAHGYAAHARTHMIKDRKYACEYCSKAYYKPIPLERHIEVAHPEVFEGQEKTFICDSCGMSFYNKASFNGHRYRYHGRNPKRVDKQRSRKPRKATVAVGGAEDGMVKAKRKRRTKEEMLREREVMKNRKQQVSEHMSPPRMTPPVMSPPVMSPPVPVVTRIVEFDREAQAANRKRQLAERFYSTSNPERSVPRHVPNSNPKPRNMMSMTHVQYQQVSPEPPPPPAHRNPPHVQQFYQNESVPSHLIPYFLQNSQMSYNTDPHYLYH